MGQGSLDCSIAGDLERSYKLENAEDAECRDQASLVTLLEQLHPCKFVPYFQLMRDTSKIQENVNVTGVLNKPMSSSF